MCDSKYGFPGTGRTTHMLKIALKYFQTGKKVVMVAHNAIEQRSIFNMALGLLAQGHPLKPLELNRNYMRLANPAGGSLEFRNVQAGDWNWSTHEFHGLKFDYVLVDHHALEMHTSG